MILLSSAHTATHDKRATSSSDNSIWYTVYFLSMLFKWEIRLLKLFNTELMLWMMRGNNCSPVSLLLILRLKAFWGEFPIQVHPGIKNQGVTSGDSSVQFSKLFVCSPKMSFRWRYSGKEKAGSLSCSRLQCCPSDSRQMLRRVRSIRGSLFQVTPYWPKSTWSNKWGKSTLF